MTTVFLSGSRRISRLNEEIRRRLHDIIQQNFRIVVGDANGADKALQKYFADVSYPNVTVYCSGETCRNNLGSWESKKVLVDSHLKGREFYTQKDKKMADDADYGVMLWDGKSAGTLSNVVELLKRNKKALVYLSPEKTFYLVSSVKDVRELLRKCDRETASVINNKIKLNGSLEELERARQVSLSF